MKNLNKNELKEQVVDYASKVFFFCVKRCNSRMDAEDLSQTILLEVLEAIDKGADVIIAGRYIIGSRDVRRSAQDFLAHFPPDPDNMRLAMDEDENIEVKDE